jgi:hypothetical protein
MSAGPRPDCRGLLACANQNEPHTNGSQFFITLDRCEWLDKKNTIFGKVGLRQWDLHLGLMCSWSCTTVYIHTASHVTFCDAWGVLHLQV